MAFIKCCDYIIDKLLIVGWALSGRSTNGMCSPTPAWFKIAHMWQCAVCARWNYQTLPSPAVSSIPHTHTWHILLTGSRLQEMFCYWLHCVPPRTATTLFRAPTVDLATGRFQSLLLELGSGCRPTSRPHRARPKCSNAAWKHFCLTVSTATNNKLSFRVVMRHRSICRRRITNACDIWQTYTHAHKHTVTKPFYTLALSQLIQLTSSSITQGRLWGKREKKEQ